MTNHYYRINSSRWGIVSYSSSAGEESVARRWRHTAVGAFLVFTAAAGLAGCTPAEPPMAALRSIDGETVLVLADCPNFTATRVSAYPINATSSSSWRISQEVKEPIGEITLFQVPSGWRLDEQTLGTFQPGQEYSVRVSDRADGATPVHFTLEQLAELEPDEVLVGRGEAVTLSQFHEKVDRAC